MSARRLRFALPAGLLLLGLLVALSRPPQAGSQPPASDPTAGARKKESANPNSNVLPADWVQAFTWRSIGPANMSGRITALAVNPNDPSMYWVATASGGLLKTTNNGVTFEHQFDKEATVSIGDVAVAPSNPNVVWVGTGENNPRNSVSYGDGVYKSTDGGKTWKNMGLKHSYQIGRVVIHPSNPDVVYVGALGRLYGPSEERGLYKTSDGGKSWKKVLHIDENTGIIDIAMHPSDPNIMLVASWERLRDGFDSWPGDVPKEDGYDGYDPIRKWGKGSGLWRTTDGENFVRVTQGLPRSEMGRIGLDFCKSQPNVVYAIVDCKEIGKGPPQLQVYAGVVCRDANGKTAVSQVQAKSPAEKAGLKVGDVIEEVGGKPVATFDQLLDTIRQKKAGEVVPLKYSRNGASKSVKLALARRPGAVGARGAGGPGGGGMAAALANTGYLGITGDDTKGGAVLTQVTEGAPAEKAGLKVGDVVTQIDGKKVADYESLLGSLTGKKPGEKVKLTVKRGEQTKEIEATLGQRQFGGGAGGGGPTSRTRPYGAMYGGQAPNIQDMQGSKGNEYGGVYKSTDAGATWTRVNSLNPRPMYFSQVRVDPSNPDNVYLLGIQYYRSSDGGATFTADLGGRAAPRGGRGGRGAAGPAAAAAAMAARNQVHADGHAMWINPRDGRHMILGTDGGVYVSYDAGANWDHLNHVSIGQFYHVAVSPNRPYYVYGGLQDNGSWGGPAETRGPTGPINEDWISVGGGDGFTCRVDSSDPDVVYFTSQGGNMGRRNLRTGEVVSIRPPRIGPVALASAPKEGGEGRGRGAGRGKEGGGEKEGKGGRAAGGHRFNWSTPFILSSHNPRIFYAGSQYVLRSVNRGENLKVISPELTLTKRGSMFALAESPLNPDVLWAGTDDGGLWVTRNGGKDWVQITPQAVGLEGPRWVSSIEASRAREGRAYVAFDGHRSNDDRPLLFATEDFGKTWKCLNHNLPGFGSTRVLREDLYNHDLLYCGTEFHFFVSLDRGGSWTRLNNNLPTVAVHEVAIHPTAGEIVVATHGRSLWALDVTALRRIKPDDFRKGTPVLYEVATAERFPPKPRMGRTNRRFVGENPPSGAQIWVAIPPTAEKVSLKIVDIEGKLVRELPLPEEEERTGLMRISWNLTRAPAGGQGRAGMGGARAGGRRGAGGAAGRPAPPPVVRPGGEDDPPVVPGGRFGGFAGGGAQVPAGTYKVVLTVDGKELTQPVRVMGDPPPPGGRFGAEEEED